jgi:hypothetical protein
VITAVAARGTPLRFARGYATRPRLWRSDTTTRDTTAIQAGAIPDVVLPLNWFCLTLSVLSSISVVATRCLPRWQAT